jgi:hypothetical protein
MSDKIKLKVIPEKFNDFIDKLSDLLNIDDTVKLKIDNDEIMMYSTLGGSVMLGFKNFLIKTSDYFEITNELDYTYDVIIANCNKFVKNLEFLKSQPKVTLSLSCKESKDDKSIMNARSIQVSGGKLKINWISAENYEIRDISKKTLEKKLNIKNRKWSFILRNSQFSDIKKLSNINSDKIINIEVNEGKVIVSEKSAWEIEIGEIEIKSANFILNKRFLKCIDSEKEEIEFNLFDSFILIKDKSSNLMLSYEQDFSEDDI